MTGGDTSRARARGYEQRLEAMVERGMPRARVRGNRGTRAHEFLSDFVGFCRFSSGFVEDGRRDVSSGVWAQRGGFPPSRE